MLERFYEPERGQILIDGTPIQDFHIATLRSQISLVSQEPVLFVGTIAENIAYGKQDATQQEIEEAAKAANAHNFIMTFPGNASSVLNSDYLRIYRQIQHNCWRKRKQAKRWSKATYCDC